MIMLHQRPLQNNVQIFVSGKMLSIYNTFREITDSDTNTAVIPLGSVEGKGPHLPLGSDLIIAEAFAREYCRDRDVYLLPTIPFGTSECQRGFAGTVYLENDTLWDVIYDLVNCLKRYGFQQVIILNFCSYNWVGCCKISCASQLKRIFCVFASNSSPIHRLTIECARQKQHQHP